MNKSINPSAEEKRLDARARRAARSAGYVARKSRWRRDTIDNAGGFMLLDGYSGNPIDGWVYDLSAEYVIDFCREAVS